MPLGCLDLLVHDNQLAQRGAREVLDVAEIQQDLPTPIILNERKHLVSDDLDVRFVEDFLVDEARHGDFTDVLKIKSAMTCPHSLLPFSLARERPPGHSI